MTMLSAFAFFLLMGIIIYLMIFFATYNDTIMIFWLCRHTHLLQYEEYDSYYRLFRFCITDVNGREILSVDLNRDLDILIEDNVSKDTFHSCSAACLIATYILKKRLLKMVPTEDLKEFLNSNSFKNRLK